jgi:hypothetical protein
MAGRAKRRHGALTNVWRASGRGAQWLEIQAQTRQRSHQKRAIRDFVSKRRMAANEAVAAPDNLTVGLDLCTQALCPVQALASLQQHLAPRNVINEIFAVRALPKGKPSLLEGTRGFRAGAVRFDDG